MALEGAGSMQKLGSKVACRLREHLGLQVLG